MSIKSALASGTFALRALRGTDRGVELTGGDERLAALGPDRLELAGRRLELRAGRGHEALVDVERGATVATIQRRAHGAVAIAVGTHRFRFEKEHVIPITFQVTEGFGGPQVIRAARLGSKVRVRAGSDLEAYDSRTVDLLAVVVVAILMRVPAQGAASSAA